MAISYGKGSQAQITTLDGRLQRLLHRYSDAADSSLDITVVQGWRGEADQNKAFAEGKSKLQWPNSAHNKTPAKAFDFAPYVGGRLVWTNKQEFLKRQAKLREVAAAEHIPLKPIISWDLPHVELA